MKSDTSLTIDDIKKKYSYKIDPLDLIFTVYIKYCLFYGRFLNRLEDYKFEENIKEIKNIITNKGDKIPKNILDPSKKIIEDISDGCQEIRKKVDSHYDEITPILSEISNNYKKNKDKPGAAEIYKKIGKELLDKEIKTFIHYEKILINYNDCIINIKKNLTN